MARFIIKHAPSLKNEAKVIHVAKRWLEFIAGDESLNEEKPDAAERRKQAVDRTFYIKKQKYALEHTCIEAFPAEFKSDGLWNGNFGSKMKELEAELNNSLSLSYDLELLIPNKISVGEKNLPNFLSEVKKWIISQSIQLGESFPENIAFTRVRIANRMFRLKLSRRRSGFSEEEGKGRFRCIRAVESEESHDRRNKVEKAFRSKANKLSTHKEKGSKTVLVMEWRYRIPTPYSPIIYAHRILKESYQNVIDMVILVGIDNKEWTIKYTAPDLKISEKELMDNWWLYNWEEDSIRKYMWS